MELGIGVLESGGGGGVEGGTGLGQGGDDSWVHRAYTVGTERVTRLVVEL